MKLQRYEVTNGDACCSEMPAVHGVCRDDGEWVRAEDVEKLEAELKITREVFSIQGERLRNFESLDDGRPSETQSRPRCHAMTRAERESLYDAIVTLRVIITKEGRDAVMHAKNTLRRIAIRIDEAERAADGNEPRNS